MAETRNRGRKIIQEFRVQLEEAARAKYGKGKSHWYISISEKLHLTPRRVGGFFCGKASDHATAIVEHLGLNPQKVLEYPGSPVLTSISVDIDWRQKCLDRLENQKSLTLNPLLNGRDFRIDDIHVPLGLIQEKKKSQSENSEKDTEIELFTHYRFLSDAIGGQKRRLAIVGEPGAGKTTLMVKIGEYIRDIGLGVPLWISLGLLAGRSITDYLRDEWIRGDLDLPEPLPIENELTSLIQFLKSNEIWLLLDGVDEMSETNTLDRLRSDLSKGWAESARSIVSCRLNVWYVDRQALGVGADVYQMQTFEIAADPAQDMTFKFTHRFFSRVEADKLSPDGDLTIEQQQASERIGQTQALLLRQELLAPGKEKVRESVRNPLRLGLLCNIWDARQGLPETKAILYGRFVEWFYQWKDNLVHLSLAQRQDLNTKLGELARQGIDRAQLYFTEAEALVILGEEGWKLAKGVGWLNSLVRRGDEYIYGFYHATFQEYFAACSVSDWDFWLPRDHVDCPVTGKQYRIFESKWKEVILLWLGQPEEKVSKNEKEEFIKYLVEFKELDRHFYDLRAYFLAAVGVAEFRDCSRSHEIIQNIVEFQFGSLNAETGIWTKWIDTIADAALPILFETDRGKVIESLVDLISTRQDEDICNRVALILEEIGKYHPVAVSALVTLINSNRDKYVRERAIGILSEIGEGSLLAIETLVNLINNINDEYVQISSLRSLAEIGKGDPLAIETVVNLIQRTNDELLYREASWILGKIDPSNSIAIAALVKLINTTDYDSIRQSAWILGLIDPGNSIAITTLSELICKDKDEDSRRELAYILGIVDPDNSMAIETLIDLICTKDDEFIQANALDSLGEIGIGNQRAIETLLDLIHNTQNDYLRRKAAVGLRKIGRGDRNAIDSLIALVVAAKDKNHDGQAFWIAMDIMKDNQKAIEALVDLMYASQDESLHKKVAQALGEIGQGNQKAIEALAWLIRTSRNENLICQVTVILEKIDPGNPLAINALVELVCTSQDKSSRLSLEWIFFKTLPCSPTAIEKLIKLIKTSSNELSCQKAVKLLGLIGQDDSMAIETLIKLIRTSPDEALRR